MTGVTGAAAKARAGQQRGHLGHGKLFSIPPPPSSTSARTGGIPRPLLGPAAGPPHGEDGGSRVQAKSNPETLTAPAGARARTPREAPEGCASALRQIAVGVEVSALLLSRTHRCFKHRLRKKRERKSFTPSQNNVQEGNEQPAIVIEMDERAAGFPQSVSGNILEKNMKCCCSLKIATLRLNY